MENRESARGEGRRTGGKLGREAVGSRQSIRPKSITVSHWETMVIRPNPTKSEWIFCESRFVDLQGVRKIVVGCAVSPFKVGTSRCNVPRPRAAGGTLRADWALP